MKSEMADKLAKKMADRIGHGIREKCYVHAEVAEEFIKEEIAALSSLSSNGLYGAVQWINDKPILDGMPYFETEEACIEYAGRMGGRHTPPGISVRYTIIRLERAI